MVANSEFVLGTLKNPQNAKAQQHGVDLTLDNVYEVCRTSETGVYKDRTIAAEETVCKQYDKKRGGWDLIPGVYSIYFEQGIKVPSDHKANIIHRSSVARCGGEIYAGEYDPGFETERMGAFLVVHSTFFIERGARVAQIVMSKIDGKVEEYNGQWQRK